MCNSRCPMCRMVNPSTACTVEGRVFVNSAFEITGLITGCPMKKFQVNWWLVSDWYLVGTVDVGSKTVACAEQREVNGAEHAASILGLLGKDLRTTGLWQDDEVAGDLATGD